MPPANHINPDHFLQTSAGRIDTPERGRTAWEQAYAELAARLLAVGGAGTLYVVCGLQGAGKSTWVRSNAGLMGPNAIFFDAALPSRKHRVRALRMAAGTGTPVVAVWINAPFEVALRRNAARPPDERVPEHVIEHVRDQLEPPSLEEGFAGVIEVDACS
ncbi:MAG: AAA family ATPase [Bacteroidetes bacterium]|nr:AAA family ATPase [Bacteroidota bacterium]